MDILENVKKYIKNCAYNEEQEKQALEQLKEYEPKIKKVLAYMVYNKDFGKELHILTTPNLDIKLKFNK